MFPFFQEKFPHNKVYYRYDLSFPDLIGESRPEVRTRFSFLVQLGVSILV